MEISNEAVEAARSAIKYLSHPDTPWSDEQVKAILTAALAHMPVEAGEVWLPIETAPKDTVVLAAHDVACMTVWWEATADDGHGGWTDGSTNRYDEYTVYPVTHWMHTPPLPGSASPPPAAQAGSGVREPMKLGITKEWFEKRAALEGDLEIGAGRRTSTINLTPEEIAELEQLALSALPQWAQGEILAYRALAAAQPPSGPLAVEGELVDTLRKALVDAQLSLDPAGTSLWFNHYKDVVRQAEAALSTSREGEDA